MKKRIGFWLLKLIGVGLFVLILARIDREGLLIELKSTDTGMLAISFPVVFLIYFCKTQRFKELVHTTGVRMPLKRHWQIFNIGIFLANITPGKIGEVGRAAYLKTEGIKMAAAIAVTIIDRAIDAICISIIALFGIGILFGWQLSIAASCVLGIGLLIGHKILAKHIPKGTVLPIGIWTIAAWILHFVWAILIARAVGIDAPLSVLVAVLTFAGVLSLFPIAPSGLGTRDATLIVLLAPYGVEPENAVALALLMFLSIILSGFLGGWYFLRGK